MESRTPRPKPKIDFTIDALDYRNVNLLRQFVTDQGRILPRKYTGMLPLALSYDHRVIDGASAAKFVVDLVKAIETFAENDLGLE